MNVPIAGSPISPAEVSPDAVPPAGVKEILSGAALFVDDSLQSLGEFERVLRISHPDGFVSFFAQHTSTYATNGETESRVQVVDLDRNNEYAGDGEIRLGISNRDNSYFKDKPFVDGTTTREDLLGNGLGRRRILSMNAVSLLLYGLPLHSGTSFTHPAAQRIWERLEEEGAAVSYTERNRSIRYNFIASKTE